MEHSLMGPTFWMLGSGLLIGRLVIGTLMIAHSGQKLFGWLDGDGLGGTAGSLEQIGFQPGRRFAAAAAVAELLSGMLLVLGLFGPVGPALLITVMLVAALSVHRGKRAGPDRADQGLDPLMGPHFVSRRLGLVAHARLTYGSTRRPK